MRRALGIDIGGTSLRLALVDEDGKIDADIKHAFEDRSPEAVLEQIAALARELDAPTDAPVGVGLAAQLWVHEGKVAVAPNLDWRDLPFGPMLHDKLGRPVRLVNDLSAITVGEARVGAGRGAADVVCVYLGTGLGMGAVVQGRMLEGADGLATELGHIKIESIESGRLCGCGQRGCIEAYSGGRHLPALLHEIVQGGTDSVLRPSLEADPDSVTADRIEAAAGEGDAACELLWQQIGERMARAVGDLLALLNPRVVVLGGGVLFGAPSLKQRIATRLRDYAPVAHGRVVEVRDAELGDRAGLIGAGLLALEG